MMSSTDPRPNFWTRLGRAFIGFLKFLLLFLFLAALALGAWLGYRELTRSLNAINGRAEIALSQVDLVRRDVDSLMADTADAEALATLQAQVTALEAEVEASDTALEADLNDQQEILTGLQLQVAALITNTATYSEEIDLLQRGLVALQEDVNANSAMVDELGGAVDQVEADMASLETEFASVREDAGELAAMQRALTLFRVWELLSRARLHLSQGNAGLAETDVATALGTVNGLAAADAEGEASDPVLARLQERLALTLESLPAEPDTAVRDLQTAWETLDEMVATIVGVSELEATVPLTATGTLTATAPLTTTTP